MTKSDGVQRAIRAGSEKWANRGVVTDTGSACMSLSQETPGPRTPVYPAGYYVWTDTEIDFIFY
jgi:hypothetical protein